MAPDETGIYMYTPTDPGLLTHRLDSYMTRRPMDAEKCVLTFSVLSVRYTSRSPLVALNPSSMKTASPQYFVRSRVIGSLYLVLRNFY